MLKELCMYNSKVFVPIIGPCGDNPYVQSHRFSFHEKSECPSVNFKRDVNIKIPVERSSVKEIRCGVFENSLLKLRSLIVFVKTTIETFIFSYTDGFAENFLTELKCDFWPKDFALKENALYSFTHGPTLLFITDHLNLFSFAHNTKKSYDIKSTPNSNFTKILQFSSFKDLLGFDKVNVFFVALRSTSSIGIYSINLYSVESDDEIGTLTEKITKLSTKHFFPINYESDITAIEVLNFNVFASAKSNNYIKNDPGVENTTVLCTSRQCLVFTNGNLKRCFTNSISEVGLIKTVFSCNTSDEINILLQSCTQGVCCINVKHKGPDEKIKLWEDATTVLLGDILMNGSKQLLLIRNKNIHSWAYESEVSEFLSTTTTIPVGHSGIPDEYLTNTIIGLQKKIANGKLALAKKQQEVSEKTSAIIDVLSRLGSHSLEECTPNHGHVTSFQDALVDIILCKDENNRELERSKKPATVLKLYKQWMTIFNEFWILCWTFCNESERYVCHPTVALTIQDEQAQCIQKVFTHSSSLFSAHSKSKKQVDPGEHCTILAALKIPSFRTETIAASYILSWYIGSLEEFDNEFLLPEKERSLSQQQFSSSLLDLSVKELFSRKMEDKSIQENILPARAVQQSLVLNIAALNSDLSCLEEILTTNQSCINKMSIIVVNDNIKSILFETENSPLYAVSVIFEHLDNKTVEAEAYTRNEQELLLLVHWLYNNLPDDVGIFPKEHASKHVLEMNHRILSTMKDEVDLLTSTLIAHNLNLDLLKKQTDFSNLKHLEGVGNVFVPKDTFLRVRKALAKKECITDNIAKNLF